MARSDGLTVLRKKSSGTEAASAGGSAAKSRRRTAGDSNSLVSVLSIQYKKLKNEPVWERVKVKRSPIHRWGLFAERDIDAHDMVIEYVGETIRAIEADKREKIYDLTHDMGGCYMFRLDSTTIVDATHKGNMARFMNHCCDPNCYAKVVSIDKSKHIIIFSNRKIVAGEEIVYDYQFPFEADAIQCNCGSVNCIGRMN